MCETQGVIHQHMYLDHYRTIVTDKFPLIKIRILELCDEFEQLISAITKENFFLILALLFGIDSKLLLLTDFLVNDYRGLELTESEMLMMEKDYNFYFKELCGYTYQEDTPMSLHFSIL